MNVEYYHEAPEVVLPGQLHAQHMTGIQMGGGPVSSSYAQTLHVNFTNWKGKRIRITTDDPSLTANSYSLQQAGNVTHTVYLKMRKPNMTFYLGDQETAESTIGTGQLQSWSSKINVALMLGADQIQQHIQLKNKGKWWSSKTEFTYNSPSFGGAPITWRNRSSCSVWDMICLDERGMPIAQFAEYGKWSMSLKKIGTIQFVADQLTSSSFGIGDNGGNKGGAMGGGQARPLLDEEVRRRRDEIIVVGLTLAYDQYVTTTNATVAAVT